jgi:hypothetical protein
VTAPNAWRWGVPDWRDPEAYEKHRTARQWRWEFLRRRADYREDWLLRYEPSRRRWLAAYQSTRLPPGVTSWEERFRHFAYGSLETKERYGLVTLLDPSLDASDRLLMHVMAVTAAYFIRSAIAEDELLSMEKHGRSAYVFDLNEPIGAQIELARKNLQLMQSDMAVDLAQQRKHLDKWPLYLRVIDARDTGATWDAIERTLPNHRYEPSGARQIWERGQRLMFKRPA